MSENEKTCDLCYEDFDRENHEPRKLPCCHTYCSQCLDRMVLRNASITCPNDRSIHTLGGLGVFGLPLDSSKLADIDKREVTSPVGSINFSSDFVDPPRPTTAWSYRQAQNHVNSNQLPAHREPYITPQSTGYNYQPRSYPNMSYNYNTQFHCFPHIHIHSQHIAPSGWHSPYQWSYHFNNTNQFHPPMMTTATTVTHGGNNGQNIIMSSPGGQIVISQGGNNQSINLFHF